MDTTPMPTPTPTPPPPAAPGMVHPFVRGAAGFLLLAGLAALGIAAWMIVNATGLLAVFTGLGLLINGVALCFLAWSPALLGQPPRHWPTIIVVFAVSVALELVKRVL